MSVGARESSTTKRSRGRVRRILAGVLLAVLLLPVALILPLRWLAPSTSAFMLEYRYLGGAGTRDYDYRWVDWNGVSPWAPLAMVAAEDQKFPLHYGFDMESIQDALASTGDRVRGASTISQQTVKNLYLWPGRNFVRKGIEAWLTVYLELLLPKKRILELYLNVAELGPGVYGVDAASRSYFRKPARQLGPHEAALLAAVLPNPLRMSAGRPSAYVRQRAAWIERQMRALGGPHYLAQL